MAVTITNLAFGESFATDATLDTGATVTGTTANNDWFVVVAGLSNATRTITSVTDTAGNVYTQRAYIVSDAPSLDAVLYVFTAPVTTNITNGTITVNISSSAGQKVVQVYRVRPSSGTVSFIAADTTGVTGTADTTHSAATVSVSNANTIFGVAVLGTHDSITGDSDTTNGSWSSVVTRLAWDGVAGSGAVCCSSQYKTVTGTGNQSWACFTTSARNSARTYLVIKAQSAEFTLAAALGQYTLSGTAATPRLGHSLIAAAGSYALTGTAATFINTGVNKSIVAAAGSYSLLGTDATLTHGYKLDATTAGSYALTGVDATLRRALPMVADVGSYALTGTDATLTKASIANKVLGVDSGVYTLTGTDATLRAAFKLDATTVGSYILTGSAVALVTAANKVLLAEGGTYVLTGTNVALTAGVAPPSVSPLHIGEWPLDKKKRQRREAARAQEQKAKDRFRRAIARLLEGLPPEFDEPEALDQALDSAVQAANLLYAMSAPIREINAVNELIDHIRQLRIAQPIVQLHLAQAYNQAHRHLKAKAQEDVAMTLLLGE